MAATFNNPVVFDTANDALTDNWADLKSFRVESIAVATGATGGTVTVLDGPTGEEVFPTLVMGVNDRESFYINSWLKDVEVTVLPSGAQVYIWLSPGPRR